MRFIFKLLTAPVVLLLSVFGWILSGIVHCSVWFLRTAAAVLGVLGVIALFSAAIPRGFVFLFLALLLSPIGLPLVAVGLIGLIQQLRFSLLHTVL